MKSNILLLAFAFWSNLLFGQSAYPNEDSLSGGQSANFELPRIQVVPIYDSQHDRPYELYIKLPEGYMEDAIKRFPVIYYTDAIWHVEILSGATDYLIENAILVGISWQLEMPDSLSQVGEYVSRFRDYTYTESTNPDYQIKYQFGQAEDHLRFIREDVFEYVERNYRTKADNRSYFGYSLGGEFGAYILLKRPDAFKNYVLGSPSFREGDARKLLDMVPDQTLNANVFLSHGTEEEGLGEEVRVFVNLLEDRKDSSLKLNYETIEGTHQTAFPLTGVRSMTWLKELIDE